MRIFFVLSILFSLQSFAIDLLVTDVDDTIKRTHVKDALDAAASLLKSTDSFHAMNAAYSLLLAHGSPKKMIYLSNGFEVFRSRYEKFLSDSKFPAGSLYLRKKGNLSDHKLVSLRSLIKANLPKTVYLFGDNGQRDEEIYNSISSEFPNIKFVKFIRIVYPLEQISSDSYYFVSPFEIISNLAEKGMISFFQYSTFLTQHGALLLARQSNSSLYESYFPKWLACDGHRPQKLKNAPLSRQLDALLLNICP